MKRLVVGIVLRVVHAAIVELQKLDTRVAEELRHLPAGTGYHIRTGYKAPALSVEWDGSALLRKKEAPPTACCLHIKSLSLAFRLFTGQMGLAQAYAYHAFSLAGDIADVMKLARMVNLVEAYLFPRFITRRILTDVPPLRTSPLKVYAKMAAGFLTGKY